MAISFDNNANNGNIMDTVKPLDIIETLTIEQFKDLMDTPSVSIKRNPHTGKLFFVYSTKLGNRTGKVTTKGKGVDGRIVKPVISKLSEIDPKTNENVWILHEESTLESLQEL